MQFFFFLALAIAVLAIIFTAQNNAPATISLFIWKIQSSIAVVIGVSLFAGALVSFFVSLPANLRVRWYVRSLQKKMTEVEAKLEQQKTISADLAKKLAEKSTMETEKIIPTPSSEPSQPS